MWKVLFFREKIELSPKIDLHSGSIAQQSLLLHTHHTTYSLRKIHATWLLFKPSTFFIFRFLIQSPSLVCCKAAIPPALLHEQLQFSPNYPRPFKLETLFDRGKNCSYTLWLNCINKLKKSSWFLLQKRSRWYFLIFVFHLWDNFADFLFTPLHF